MTVTSASNFLSKVFSKIENFLRRLYQLVHHSFFFLVSLAILEVKIYKTKGHDCEHHIAFWVFLESLNRELATFTLGIYYRPIEACNSRQTETTTILDWVLFHDIVLRLLEMCLSLRENKVAVTEEKCVEERISLASLKEDTYWVKQVYYVQSRSGLLVKLRLPSECPSSPYDKATIKQKSNTVKFPHHPPCTLPNLCFSLPPLSSLPQSKSLFCKTIGLTRKFILCMQRKQSKNCFNYKRSKFLRNIGTFEERG